MGNVATKVILFGKIRLKIRFACITVCQRTEKRPEFYHKIIGNSLAALFTMNYSLLTINYSLRLPFQYAAGIRTGCKHFVFRQITRFNC
jgi:hypothetical protein